jgi:hypothetical protein
MDPIAELEHPLAARRRALSYLEEVNALAKRPAWYDALVHDCTI